MITPRILLFAFSAAVTIIAPLTTRADTWLRAEIYYLQWDATTRVALSPEDVRQNHDYHRTIRKAVPQFVTSLELDKMRKSESRLREDARLVIDLYTDAGARITYYASRFHFRTADDMHERGIDEKFRRRFRDIFGR